MGVNGMTEPRWADASGLVDHVAAEMQVGGVFALPGGSTPLPYFADIAALPLGWDRVTLIPGDERQVPHDDPLSNFGALSRAFAETDAVLTPLSEGMAVPPLDLVWLGVGMDGHVASIFPSVNPARDVETGVIAVTPDPLPAEAPVPRLSLSLATMAAADKIVLLIKGDAKRRALDAALSGGTLPVARLLRMAQGTVTIFWSA